MRSGILDCCISCIMTSQYTLFKFVLLVQVLQLRVYLLTRSGPTDKVSWNDFVLKEPSADSHIDNSTSPMGVCLCVFAGCILGETSGNPFLSDLSPTQFKCISRDETTRYAYSE
jgi:hypothetical protein